MHITEQIEAILAEARDACTNASAESNMECIQLHFHGYAEDGYDDPPSGVIALGNWNSITEWNDHEFATVDTTMPEIARRFEEIGVELEWEDEWMSCDDCGRLVRSSPNGYGWTPSYYVMDCSVTCDMCADPAAILEDLEACDSKALTLDIDPAEHGYVKHDQEYENGLHHGQDDDPKKIGARLMAMGITRYLFKLDSTGQFSTSFSVYVHESQADLLDGPVEGKCDISPATAMEQSLRAGSIAASKLEGEGIKYIRCKSDGAAEARLVSPEEFVAGIRD